MAKQDSAYGLENISQSCIDAIDKLDSSGIKLGIGLEEIGTMFTSDSSSSADLDGWRDNWQEYDKLNNDLSRKEQLVYAHVHQYTEECGNLSIKAVTSKGNSWSSEQFASENWRENFDNHDKYLAIWSSDYYYDDNNRQYVRDEYYRKELTIRIEENAGNEKDFKTAQDFYSKANGKYINYGISGIRPWVFDDFHALMNLPATINVKYKALVEANPDITLVDALQGAASGPYYAGADGRSFIYINGVYYHCMNVLVEISPVLLVPESMENTKETYIAEIERNYDKIFSDEYEPIRAYRELDACEYTKHCNNDDMFLTEDMSDYIAGEINKDLGTVTAKPINGYMVEYKRKDSNNVRILYIGIISVDDAAYKSYSANSPIVSSIDVANGVKIDTDDPNIPQDVRLSATDRSTSSVVLSNIASGEKLLKAYDLNLVSKTLGGVVSGNFKLGVNVYVKVPTGDYGKIIARYISDDGSLTENIAAEIVTIDGEQYAKFVANHFSVYAIVEIDEGAIISRNSMTTAAVTSTGGVNAPETGLGTDSYGSATAANVQSNVQKSADIPLILAIAGSATVIIYAVRLIRKNFRQ